MYDSREKAVRDRQWEINCAYREGEAKGEIHGKIELIRTLQGLLRMPLGAGSELPTMTLEQLARMAASLQEQLRGRVAWYQIIYKMINSHVRKGMRRN